MCICTFFGHRDAPDSLRPSIEKVLSELITSGKADKFYVGNQGNFDKMVLDILRELSKTHTHIKYNVVLAYIPKKEIDIYNETIVPDGIEYVPRRFAIAHRNKWMVDKSDYVIAYITHSFGGAAKFVNYATKQRRIIINLSKNNVKEFKS